MNEKYIYTYTTYYLLYNNNILPNSSKPFIHGLSMDRSLGVAFS